MHDPIVSPSIAQCSCDKNILEALFVFRMNSSHPTCKEPRTLPKSFLDVMRDMSADHVYRYRVHLRKGQGSRFLVLACLVDPSPFGAFASGGRMQAARLRGAGTGKQEDVLVPQQ
eukprot:scaffold271_cov336-Pavlova_lutheri.AAC.47